MGAACVAAAVSGNLGTRFGRRFGLFLAAITSIIGPAVQCGVTTWAGLLAGKVIAGLGVGFAANFVIPYWAETTPAALRGMIIVMYQGIINVSQFIGQCINEGTHGLESRWAYRGPLLTELVPPMILIPFLFWLPDTPSEKRLYYFLQILTRHRMVCCSRSLREDYRSSAKAQRTNLPRGGSSS